MKPLTEIKKLKKKISKLRKEINYLNILLQDADEGSWDLDLIYKDIRYGRINGNEVEYCKPDKRMAMWFSKRWDLKNEEDLEE